jgi:hypothetical protein
MAINNYANLKASIANTMGRKDLTEQIPDFIEFAEAVMNRRLRVRQMTCGASATVSGGVIGMPADYLGMRILRLTTGEPLEQVSPEVMQAKRDANCSPGRRLWY